MVSNVTIWLAQSTGAVEYTHRIPKTPSNECPIYDTKYSNGEFPVMRELWGMLPSLPGPVWAGVVAPDRVLAMGQIELNWVLMLNRIVWSRIVLTLNCV